MPIGKRLYMPIMYSLNPLALRANTMSTNRNAYRNWTSDELLADTLATWARMEINGVPTQYLVDSRTGESLQLAWLDYDLACKRNGLRVVFADVTYELDAEGKPILDEKGKPVEANRSIPEHDFACNVKVEGLTDSYGTPIPKGLQYFVNDKQPANRPLNKTAYTDLQKRLPHWPLTGEPLLKDESGGGQSEQHRQTAVIVDTLTGSNLAWSDKGIPVITIDGCSIGASGAIDTGKPKTTADDFGSHPDLLPSPRTLMDYVSSQHVGYGQENKQSRVKILKEAQGVAKRLVLRMLGKNIKASVFGGYESSGNASAIALGWNGFDEVVNMAYAYVIGIPLKQPDNKTQTQRPCSVWEVATAYCLWLLRNSPKLESIEALSEYQWPEVDCGPLQEFLTDLTDGSMKAEGPLADWCRDRVTATRLKDKDESSFAQVLIAMRNYLDGKPVDPAINKADSTGPSKESGAKFTFLGGADRGPIPKKVKE
jgi:hypothetical protein